MIMRSFTIFRIALTLLKPKKSNGWASGVGVLLIQVIQNKLNINWLHLSMDEPVIFKSKKASESGWVGS